MSYSGLLLLYCRNTALTSGHRVRKLIGYLSAKTTLMCASCTRFSHGTNGIHASAGCPSVGFQHIQCRSIEHLDVFFLCLIQFYQSLCNFIHRFFAYMVELLKNLRFKAELSKSKRLAALFLILERFFSQTWK